MRRLFVILAAIALSNSAPAADCVDYTDFLHHLGSTGTPTAPTDVAVAGSIAYVTDTAVGLHVFDVADPRTPRLLATYQASAGLFRVVICGSVAYLASIDARLIVLDITDPASPQPITNRDLPGNGRDFAVDGDLLLVACGDGGLALFGIADPAAPLALRGLTTPGTAYGVAAAGPLAVLADGDAGLHTVDIADPDSPRIIATIATAGAAFDVDLLGQVAHVAVDDAGLELVAVADPAAPVSLAQLPLSGLARRLCVEGTTTFVVGGGLHTIDTDDPLGPVLIGHAAAVRPSAVAVSDSRAYLANETDGLSILDAANPASPTTISTTPTTEIAYGVATDGPLTYLAAGDLLVYDHTDPAVPRLVATAPIPGTASRVALAAGHAYVTSAGLAGLLYVVDIADPSQPVVVGEVEFPGYPGPIVAHAGALYLGDFLYGGLYVLDLANPADPRLLPTVPTGIYVIALAADGDRLYVSAGAFGGASIEVHDVADPLAPALIHILATDHQSIDGLVARDGLLFAVVNGYQQTGFTAYDFAQSTAPVELAHVPLPGGQRTLALIDETVYTANERGDIQVLDVADPGETIRLGELAMPAPAFVIAGSGDRIHAAATYAGFTILPGHCDGGVPVLDPHGTDDLPVPTPLVLAAYPNPFNPRVTIRFDLPRRESVILDVCDLRGRRIAKLVAGHLDAGRHELVWKPDDLPSGTYLTRLETASHTRTAKLVLLK